jgi:hypothetical protein
MSARTTADYCADLHAQSMVDTAMTRAAACAVFVAVVLVGSLSQVLDMCGL